MALDNNQPNEYGYDSADRNNEDSGLSLSTIWYLILRYKYLLLASVIVCLGIAYIYLRYQTPLYQVGSKILIKNERQSSPYANSLNTTFSELGFMNNSNGFDNEIEVLRTRMLNKRVVRDLKLYVAYFSDHRIKDREIYGKNSPYLVDIDESMLDSLKHTVKVRLESTGKGALQVNISYTDIFGTDHESDKTVTQFPAKLQTPLGNVIIRQNPLIMFYAQSLKANGQVKEQDIYKLNRPLNVYVYPLEAIASVYTSRLSVESTSKLTTIAVVSMRDNLPERAKDYLSKLAKSYNEDATNDNTEEARRTADFIDKRLGIISKELSATEGTLEQYKRSTGIVDLTNDARVDVTQNIEYETKLVDVNTQLQLVGYLSDYVNDSRNHLKVIPTNVGLKDAALTQMLSKYNETVIERDNLLRTVPETNPRVSSLTSQLEGYQATIRSSLSSTRQQLAMQSNRLMAQQSKYTNKISAAPGKERAMQDIMRQQEVKAGLYLMLLQKREENEITLASAAYKGKVIEEPIASSRPVVPQKKMILLIALAIGLGLPSLYHYVRQLLRYRIESGNDIAQLTKLPLLATVPNVKTLAKEKRRTILIQEGRNSLMMEVFRRLRSNLPFVLKPHENVILFTSSTSGEGKTTIAANLAAIMAFAGKRVVIVGLDIRKPRLASVFGLPDTHRGLSDFLSANPDEPQMLDSLIQKSDVSDNLDILAAGPIPPNPGELLERENLGIAINYLKEKYDYVILDTAPIGLVSDTLTIAKFADLTLYIVRANYSLRADFAMINSLSAEQRLPNVNLILNGEELIATPGYGYKTRGYKYNNYSYSYGYGYGTKRGETMPEV